MSDKSNARKVQAAFPGMSYQQALQTVREVHPAAEKMRETDTSTPLSVLIVRCAVELVNERMERGEIRRT